MANLPYLINFAIADESTPGTPPADATAWAAIDRAQIVTDSFDPAGLKPQMVEDLRSQTNALARERMIEGLRNGEFSYQVYATGLGTTTGAGTQVSETILSRILENGLGGLHRSNSTACNALGSTTTIVVAAETNFAEGCHIGWEHPDTGEVYIRRLLQNTSGTTWTLDEELPQASDDGDVIHGCITVYPDPDILANSNSSGRQLSYLMQLGSASISDAATFVTSGCVNTIGGLSWPRNGDPTFDISTQWSNVVMPNESPPTSISWSSDPLGVAPAVVGPSGRVFFQTRGTSTASTLCLVSVEPTIGITRTRVSTVTESAANMHGTCHFSVAKPDTRLKLVLANFATDEWTDYATPTHMQFRTQAGTQPGFCFAIGAANCEVLPPDYARVEDNDGRTVELIAHMGTDTNVGSSPFSTDTALTRASFYFVLG